MIPQRQRRFPVRERGRGILLRLCWGSAEVVSRFTAAALLFSMIGMPALPLRHVLLLFSAAAVLTGLLAGRGLPVAAILAIHLAGSLAVGGSLLLETARHVLPSGAPGGWESALAVLSSPSLPRAPYAAALLVVTYGLFWYAGFSFARKAPTFQDAAGRIDAGFGILFTVVFLAWGTRFPLPFPLLLLPGYLFFALCTLALAAAPPTAERHYLAGFRILGAGASLLAVLLTAGTAAAVWAYPLLTEAARTGYRIAAGVLSPLGPFLTALLRFLLGMTFVSPRGSAEPPPPPPSRPALPLEEPSWWELLLQQIFAWSMIGLVAAAGLVLIGWAAWRLWRLLGRRTAAESGRLRLRDLFAGAARFLLRLLRRLLDRAAAVLNFRGRLQAKSASGRQAQAAFARLCRWGRASGLPRDSEETAREYGMRLEAAFPRLQQAIAVLVDALHRELYAGRPLADRELHALRSCLRELQRIRHWRTRLSAAMRRSLTFR